jgi:hypothetical protein
LRCCSRCSLLPSALLVFATIVEFCKLEWFPRLAPYNDKVSRLHQLIRHLNLVFLRPLQKCGSCCCSGFCAIDIYRVFGSYFPISYMSIHRVMFV